VSFDLNNASSFIMPDKIEVIIHLAADTSGNDEVGLRELEAAKALVSAASEVGAIFLFVSSQTAVENAPTSYGRTKWLIEQEVLAVNGLVVRLGQVYGGPERGLFGILTNLVRRLPVQPAFMPSPKVQPIHVDDCAKGLLKLVDHKNMKSGVYCLASSEPISFTQFLRSIAISRVRRRIFFVPVPAFLVQCTTRIIGKKLSASLGLNRLNSLFDLPLMNTAADLETIELKLRPLSSGMHRSGNDRRCRLIQEGAALLEYILKEKPNSNLVRRYVRMVEKLRTGTALDIPTWMMRWPITLTLLDDRAITSLWQRDEFAWRIDAATVIAEASRQGAARFLGSSTQTTWPLAAFFRMAIAVSLEITWRLVRLVIPSSALCFSKKKGL
jgi:NADH dehydrogenase